MIGSICRYGTCFLIKIGLHLATGARWEDLETTYVQAYNSQKQEKKMSKTELVRT